MTLADLKCLCTKRPQVLGKTLSQLAALRAELTEDGWRWYLYIERKRSPWK